ncbi:UNVERIFIED_ORG: hypothetical protein GGE44_001028 [Rhizobium esperanzae]
MEKRLRANIQAGQQSAACYVLCEIFDQSLRLPDARYSLEMSLLKRMSRPILSVIFSCTMSFRRDGQRELYPASKHPSENPPPLPLPHARLETSQMMPKRSSIFEVASSSGGVAGENGVWRGRRARKVTLRTVSHRKNERRKGGFHPMDKGAVVLGPKTGHATFGAAERIRTAGHYREIPMCLASSTFLCFATMAGSLGSIMRPCWPKRELYGNKPVTGESIGGHLQISSQRSTP